MGSVTDGLTPQEIAAMSGGGGGGYTGDNPQGDPNWAPPSMNWAMPQQQPDRNALAGLMARGGGGGFGGGGGGGGGGGAGMPWTGPWWADPQIAAMQQANAARDPYGVDQYFGNPTTQSGSITDTGWMYALQPWQGGVTAGGQPGTPTNSGWLYGGGAGRAEPNYWANEFRTGTGGLSAQDFATFSQQVGQAAADEWVRQGGVGSMGFGGGGSTGGMGGSVGGGSVGGGSVGGGQGPGNPGNPGNPGAPGAPNGPNSNGNNGLSTGIGYGSGPIGGYSPTGFTANTGTPTNSNAQLGFATIGPAADAYGNATIGSPAFGPANNGGMVGNTIGTGNFGGGFGQGGLGSASTGNTTGAGNTGGFGDQGYGGYGGAGTY